MADTPYPLPIGERTTGILACDGVSDTFGPFDFEIYDVGDAKVYVNEGVGFVPVSATITKTVGDELDTFSIQFGEVYADTVEFVVVGDLTPARTTAVTRGGTIDSNKLEKELSVLATGLQENRRDIRRSLRFPWLEDEIAIPASVAGKFMQFNSEGNGINLVDAVWTSGGAWQSGVNYAANTSVTNDGSSYVSISAHTSAASNEPGVGASWETYWTLAAAKGEKGDQGDQGDLGPTGATVSAGLVQFATHASLLADDTLGYVGSGAEFEVTEGSRIDAGGVINVVAAEAATDHHFTNSYASPVKLKYLAGIPSHDIVLRVGSQFDTMQEAFARASALHPSDAKKVVIFIDSGFSPEAGIMGINDGDYSHIYIRSADATVNLASNFALDFMRGENCAMPVLDCYVDMAAAQALGNGRHGYHIDRGGRGYITDGSGVGNCTENGLWIRRNCIVAAQGCEFPGAGTNGCRCTHGSYGDVRGGKFNDLLGSGPQTEAGYDRFAVEVDRGYLDASSIDISGSNGRGLAARYHGMIYATNVNAENIADQAVIAANGGYIAVGGSSLGLANFNGFGGATFIQSRGAGSVILANEIQSDSAGRMSVGSGGYLSIAQSVLTTAYADAIENGGGTLFADRAEIYCRGTLLTSEGGRNDFRDAEIDKLAAQTGINDVVFKVLNGSTFNGERMVIANAEHQIVRCYGSHANIQRSALGKTAATQGQSNRAITIGEGGFVCAHGATGVAGAALQDSDTNTTLNAYGSAGVVLA